MRFFGLTALLFVSGLATLLMLGDRWAVQYRPLGVVAGPVDVTGPHPGKITTQAAGSAPLLREGWSATSVGFLVCLLLQGLAVVLMLLDRAPWVRLGLLGGALVLWVCAWSRDGLTLTAIGAIVLVLVLGWQVGAVIQQRRKRRLAGLATSGRAA